MAATLGVVVCGAIGRVSLTTFDAALWGGRRERRVPTGRAGEPDRTVLRTLRGRFGRYVHVFIYHATLCNKVLKAKVHDGRWRDGQCPIRGFSAAEH